MEAARSAAETALSIDPTLGEAIAVKACVNGLYDWDWVGAEAGFHRAIELAPSYPTAHQWYAVNLLAPRGRFEEARPQLDRASELDPASSAIAISRGIVTYYARDFTAAEVELRAVALLHPRFPLVHYFLGQCRGLLGDRSGALDALGRAVELSAESSETLAAFGHAQARAGRASDADAILARLEERSLRQYVSPALVAQVLIGLGRHDDALDRLEEARDLRATDLTWLGVRPVYDPLVGSPRFTAIAAEVGLATVG
jgi:tetratricopeptide (TPR) repeat protein